MTPLASHVQRSLGKLLGTEDVRLALEATILRPLVWPSHWGSQMGQHGSHWGPVVS